MKTRRLTLLVAIFAIITMMFVSCNSEVAENSAISEPGKELVYASFVDKGAKELSFSYDVPAYDTLFWRYSAVKKDSYGTVGQTWAGGTAEEVFAPIPTDATTPTQGLAGKVGPFSQGKWDFKLQAFRSCTKTDNTLVFSDMVFAGTATNVVLNKNQTNYIAVTVTPAAETGKIKISDAYYEWASSANAGTAQVKLVVTLVGRPDGSNSTDPVTYTYNEVLTKEASENKYNFVGVDGYIAIPVSSTSTEVTTAIPAGVYTATFKIVENTDTPTIDEFVLQTFSLKVYGGLETIISGNLTEGLSYENYFSVPEQTIASTTANSTGAAEMSVDMTPASTTSETMKTIVVFPENSLSSNTQHTLSVEVTNIETAESQFNVTTTTGNEELAVAAIGLNLTKTTVTTDETTGEVTDTTTEKVQDFNGEYVTIKTYIQSGLTGTVTVMYDGEGEQPHADASKSRGSEGCNIAATLAADEGLGYNPTTGYLSFETNHFSDFYVKTNVEALNVNSGRYYPSLATALDAALDGQTIKLLKNTETGSSYTITQPFYVKTKGLTLDLNQKSLTVTNNFSFVIEADDVTVKNGNVVSGINSAKLSRINSYVLVVNNCKNTVLDGLTITGGVSAGGSTNETPNYGAALNMVMKNCTVEGGDYYAICSQNNSDVTIESGTYSETTATSTSKAVLQADFIGTDGPAGYITVTGGVFTGTIKEGNENLILLKGGTFDHDPTAYVAPGYVAVEDTPETGRWTVKCLFDGGTGTESDPFLISNLDQFKSISAINTYSYYKWNGDSQIDASDWPDNIYLCGSFDGNGVVFDGLDCFLFRSVWNGSATWNPSEDKQNVYKIKNLVINANIVTDGWIAAVVRVAGVHYFEMENVTVHGYIEGATGVASFVCFGAGNYAPSYTYDGSIKFTNCNSDATIVSKSGNAVGFIAHAMTATSAATVTLQNSNFTGELSCSSCKYICGNWINATITDDQSTAKAGVIYGTSVNGWSYIAEGKTGSFVTKVGTLPGNIGDVFVLDAETGASYATISLIISPNPGCFTSTYMTEQVDVVDAKITSSNVRYYTIRVNQNNESGVHGNYYDVVNSIYNGKLGANTIVRITQYDSNNVILSITNYSFNDKTN